MSLRERERERKRERERQRQRQRHRLTSSVEVSCVEAFCEVVGAGLSGLQPGPPEESMRSSCCCNVSQLQSSSCIFVSVSCLWTASRCLSSSDGLSLLVDRAIVVTATACALVFALPPVFAPTGLPQRDFYRPSNCLFCFRAIAHSHSHCTARTLGGETRLIRPQPLHQSVQRSESVRCRTATVLTRHPYHASLQ